MRHSHNFQVSQTDRSIWYIAAPSSLVNKLLRLRSAAGLVNFAARTGLLTLLVLDAGTGRTNGEVAVIKCLTVCC